MVRNVRLSVYVRPIKGFVEPFLSNRARGPGCYRASSRRYSFVPRGPLRAFCHAINRRVLLMVITIPWICACIYICVGIDRFLQVGKIWKVLIGIFKIERKE